MLTIEQIDEMTPEQKQAKLDALAVEYFKTNQWKTALSELTGTTQSGIARWFRQEPPNWALLYMSTLCEHAELKSAIDAHATASARLNELSNH